MFFFHLNKSQVGKRAMEKIGVIDIGTNSMRLLIALIKKDRIIKSCKSIQTTRIGQEIHEKGRIHPKALERNFKALKEFKEKAEKERVEKVLVFGTSALRDASNAREFIDRVESELDLSIEILGGKQEAEIGFRGAIHGTQKDALVIDIGGGSTELILGDTHEGIINMTSLNIGALRMTKAYIHSDPVTQEEIIALEKEIQESIRKVALPFYGSEITIGIGGTITTLSAIKQNMKEYDAKKIHHSKLSIKDIEDILCRLRVLKLEDRKKVWGLQPSRADIIVAGVVILKSIMEILEIDLLRVSESDNLEGMLYHYLEKNKV